MAVVLVLGSFSTFFASGSAPAAADPACTPPNALPGSNFEIDTSANLKVNGGSPCIDWRADASNAYRAGVLTRNDKASGASDDAFGKGTSEDDVSPTIVDGSVPPNKSDLKVFGVYSETVGTAKFLELFWSRVQNPSGTTNMDFELNQKFCDPAANPTNCANNGKNIVPETPVRTVNDKLITYDLAQGGTVPTISIRSWLGSAWGPAVVLSGTSSAIGTVNTASIAAADSPAGAQDPYTFGEAAVSYTALFPQQTGPCGSFGSAYLKSRSSDSFSAEVKDFIAPEPVHISNCTGLTTNATSSVTIGGTISDTATLTGATANAGGTITFKAFGPDTTCLVAPAFTSAAIPVSGNGNYSSGIFTPTAVGTYKWSAHYTGDANNSVSDGLCTDANETSLVVQAQPAIVTTATASVTIGSSISDSATLSNGVSPTGTITFKVFSDNQCATQVATSSATVIGNGVYSSDPFTPSAVGTYYWTATYGGDTKNLTVSGSCLATGETSLVIKALSNISTAQTITPQDSVTLTASAGGTPTGSVTFELFGPNNATCSGAAVFTQPVALVGGSASTNNTIFWVTAATAGTYRWVVTYPGDLNHEGTTSLCGVEQHTLTINNNGQSGS
jgi:hypothetical protein